MFQTFIESKQDEISSLTKDKLLVSIVNEFAKTADSKILDIETEIDELSFKIKKNAAKINSLKNRKKETEERAVKVRLFAQIVKGLADLNQKGRITWSYYKENVYDLIEGFDSVPRDKLELYLEKIHKISGGKTRT